MAENSNPLSAFGSNATIKEQQETAPIPDTNQQMAGAPNFMSNDPYQNPTQYIKSSNKPVPINNPENSIGMSAFTNSAMAPTPTPDVARKGQVHSFSADINHAKYERYYAHPAFKELGFSPFRDNETFYNKNTSGLQDFQRTYAQWRSLAATGFMDAASFGPTSDRDAARKFEKAMAIGQSSRGGVGGFASNLFLNSGYTFGIIAEMVLEEGLLLAGTALTGGATSGTLAASIASKARLLDKATDVMKIGKNTGKVIDVMDDLQDINKARTFWQNAGQFGKTVGGTLAERLTPATYDLAKNWKEMSNLSGLAKASTSAASFYKDVRNIRLAYGESALEAGMVENEMLDKMYHEALLKNGGATVTPEQMQEIRSRAKQASNTTFSMNFPTILLSNAIVFDNLYSSFSPTKALLSQPIRKNIAGEIVMEAAKKVSPYQIFEGGFKGLAKSFTKPKSYAKFGFNYFRANFAEGGQEVLQETISGATKDYYLQDPKSPVRNGFYAMLGQSFQKQISPEGFETFLSGFLMAGPVNVVTGSVTGSIDQIKKFRDPQYKEKRVKAMDDLINKQKVFNEVYDDPFYYFDINLRNAENQGKHKEAMQRAEQDGDAKTFYDSKHAAETEHILTVMQNGQMDTMIERMETFRNMTPEERKEQFPNMKDPEQYEAKMDTIIKRAKGLEADYSLIKSRFPAPINPASVAQSDKDLYLAAQYNDIAWKNSVNQLLFMRSSFADSIKRQASILQSASADLTGTQISGADFVSLFDSPTAIQGVTSLQKLIAQKMQTIKNLQVLDESTATPESLALFKSEKAQLEALMKFNVAQNELNGVAQNAPDDIRMKAESTYAEAFTNALTAMNNGNPIMVDKVEDIMQKLIDHTALTKESGQVQAAVNYLMNPDNFTFHFARNYEAVKLGHENRKTFLDAALKAYMDAMIDNQLLKDLFNEAGVFLDPQDTKALTEDSIFPKKMFYTTDERAEVKETSTAWKKATDIINDFLKNVKDKPIPETEGDSAYDTTGRKKLPDDNRTYADLAAQYGFNLNGKTSVSAKKVLEAVSTSKFATEAERSLAKRLLTTTSEDDIYEFDNTLSHPGYYTPNDNLVHMDARYNASDYRNGDQPIEMVILHEEIHRKTVKGLEQDPAFKAKMQDLFDTTVNSPIFKEKTAKRGKAAYGTKNLAEFVAEAMSNPDFQDTLSKIQYADTQKSVWASFVDAVLDFLESTLAAETGGILKYKRLDGSVLNAALHTITTKIDSSFGGKETETQVTQNITSKTPVKDMPEPLLRDLLYVFKQLNTGMDDMGSNTLLKNWKTMTDNEIIASNAFEKWVRNEPPPVTAAISKYNNSTVKQKGKPSDLIVVKNVNDDLNTFSEWIDPNVLGASDKINTAKYVQLAEQTGAKLDAENATWEYGNLRAQVDGRLIVDVFSNGEHFLMYKSTGEGTGPESKGLWVPLFGFAKNGWFIKDMSNGVNPKFNKYGSKTFQAIADELVTKEKELFPSIGTSPLKYSGENPTSTAVVTRMIDGQQQVLMIKRGDDAIEGGKWALPGGFVDTDSKKGESFKPGKETELAAAIREVKEETGLDLSGVGKNMIEGLGMFDRTVNKDPRNTKTSWVLSHMFGFQIDPELGDTIEGTDDASDAKWFTIDELNNLQANEIAFNHEEVLISQELRMSKPEQEVKQQVETQLTEREQEKQDKLQPLIERKEEIETEIGQLRKALESDSEPTPDEAASLEEARKAAEALKKEKGLIDVIDENGETTVQIDKPIESLSDIADTMSIAVSSGGKYFSGVVMRMSEMGKGLMDSYDLYYSAEIPGPTGKRIISTGKSKLTKVQLLAELKKLGALKTTEIWTNTSQEYLNPADIEDAKRKRKGEDDRNKYPGIKELVSVYTGGNLFFGIDDSGFEVVQSLKANNVSAEDIFNVRNTFTGQIADWFKRGFEEMTGKTYEEYAAGLPPTYKTTNAEGYAYFDYPTLSYEEGLKNIQDALTNFEDGKSYTVDQIEAILKKLKVNEFTMGEFNKLKDVLKTNDVKIVATNGTGTSLGVYGEFKLASNTVYINLATIAMDPKVETTQQVAQIIVHELIHSAVVYKTYRALNQEAYGDTEQLTEIEQVAIKNLQYLFDEISKQPGMYEEYGLNNMDEMLAELSNPQFVEKLKKTKISNLRIAETTKAKNLFELLIDAIVKLISGKDITSPAYDLIYASYENLIANDSTVQQKAFEEAVKDKFVDNDTTTVISQEDAFKYRKIEYPLTIKIRDEAGKLNRLTMANIRARRMGQPQDYDSYFANGKLNVQKVLERIQELEKELSSINAQIQAIEDDYADVTAKLTPYLQPGERDKLAALGYPSSEIRGMTSAEARIRINSGLTRDEYESGIQAEVEEMEVKEQMERLAIRNKFNDLLESAETYEELQQAIDYGKEILADSGLRAVSRYDSTEISNLINKRKAFLAELVKFDDLKVGAVVMLSQNPDSKFIVIKKTAKQLQIRKFGDQLAKIDYINKQDVNSKIKYVFNPFMKEIVLESQMPSPETQDIIKQDTESAKSLSDPTTVKEDLDKMNNSTKNEADDDFFSSIKDNCQ
jgi:ADP-ribose pyrophosphatase YjhB (NUDIX family)